MATFDPSDVEVVDAPKAKKSFDPSDVEVVKDDHKIGLSGPGSHDGSEPPLEAPNVDLSTRPHVKNADGSISTVRSMGFEEDGKQVLVPTVSDDGRIMSDDEAIASYRKTGKHLGKFNTIAESNAAAKLLHENEAAKLDGRPIAPDGLITSPTTHGNENPGLSLSDVVSGKKRGAAHASRENDTALSPTPSTMMPSPYGMPGINALDTGGATEGLKTLGSIAGGELGGAGIRAIPAIAKLAQGASAVGKVAAGAAEGAGAGAGASVGAGETSPKKIAENALLGGTLGGVAPMAVRAGERAIARTENKLVDEIATGARETVRKDLGEQREVLKRIAKTDKPALKNPSDAGSLVESTQKAIEKRMALNDAKYAAHDLKSPGIGVSIGEMQDGVSKVADELRRNPSMVRAVVPKLEALSKDILAFGDPSEFVTARQARQLATDWQKVAAGGAEGAEETATQEANRNAASAVIKVLDKHIGGDPEIKRINEEISALLDANKAAKQRYATENQAGRVSEGSLRHAPQIVKDFSHGAVAGITRTGFRVAHAAFENKDAALAGIAKMVRAGETVTQADIDAAIKAGAKAASVNAIVNGGKND